MQSTLIYFHDPMCSWCYAFQPVWSDIQTQLPQNISLLRVLGGLAADDDSPMPASMQEYVRENWRKIQEVVPNAQFNFDFWTECVPRRSTYPACRAVIAAAKQGVQYEEQMLHAIQHAYYREAKNPSDYSTHVELVGELGLDVEKFEQDIVSAEINDELIRQIQFTAEIGVRGFPSLCLQVDDVYHMIPHDYTDSTTTLNVINSLTN